MSESARMTKDAMLQVVYREVCDPEGSLAQIRKQLEVLPDIKSEVKAFRSDMDEIKVEVRHNGEDIADLQTKRLVDETGRKDTCPHKATIGAALRGVNELRAGPAKLALRIVVGFFGLVGLSFGGFLIAKGGAFVAFLAQLGGTK